MTQEFMIGKREKVAHVQETSFGAGGDMATNGDRFGYNTTVEPGDWSRGYSEILNSGSDSLTVEKWEKGMKNYPFTLNFYVTSFKFLKYIMNVSTSGSGPYTHTFTLGNTINTFEMEWEWPHSTDPVIIRLLGGFAKSLTLSFEKQAEEEGGFLNARLECNAQNDEKLTSGTTVSEETRDPFRFFHVKVTLDGTEYKEVNSGEITIERGINEEDSRYTSATLNRTIGDPIPRITRITGRFNINVNDDELWKLWRGDTALTSTNQVEFIKDATNDYATFSFNQFLLQRPISPTEFEGVKNVDVIWKADYFSTAEVVDDISSY